MKNLILFIFCLTSLHLFSQTVTTLTAPFQGSGGVCSDSDGNIYIADFGDSLANPDPDGIPNNIMKLDINQNLTVYSTGFIGASGNNFDNNGTLYQSDIWDNAIYKIVGGNRTFVTSDGIVSPVGIVFDSNDNFYVCNCGNNTIRKVTPGGISTMFSSGSMFACPNGITIDEDDNLYIVNFSNNNIVKVDPSGTPTIIANTPAGNGHIDYDPVTNNLYIASFSGQQIFYLNKDNPVVNVLAGTAGVRGNDDGPFNVATFSNPNGIVVSQTGDSIYVNSAVSTSGDVLNPQYVRLISNVLLSVNDMNDLTNAVNVYPVPATNHITIETDLIYDFSNLNIDIYDIKGKLIIREKNISTADKHLKISINISSVASGVYFFKISNDNRQLINGKIIKE